MFILLIVHRSNRDSALKYFEICFVMKVENFIDITFCELNFEIMFFTLVSSTMSMGIIVHTI